MSDSIKKTHFSREKISFVIFFELFIFYIQTISNFGNIIFKSKQLNSMKILSAMIFMMDNTIEEKLIQRIHAFDSIEITEIVKTSVGLIEKLNRTKPDILFINLDKKEIEFSKIAKLIQKPPFIIGITDYKKDIQSNLDSGVFDFINSKLEMEDICRKITKIWHIFNCLFPKNSPQVNEAPPAYSAKCHPKTKNHTFVRYKKMNVKVVFDDIIFIRNTGNCLRIESVNNKVYYHNSTLKQFIAILPPENFIRINKSIIINYNKIERYEKNIIYIKNHSFKVSRIFAARLKDILKRFS